MSQKAETRLELKVKADMEKVAGCFGFKLMAGSILGLPDRVFCLRGRFIALELKVGKNKASGLQEWTLLKLRNAGAFTAVVTPENWATIYSQIKNL